MVVNVQQIQRGLANYIDTEIAQKAVGVKKFAVYFLIPQINQKVTDTITSLTKDDMFATLFDENGNIDLDKVYNQAKDAIHKTGQIELAGIVFTENDIDSLYRYISAGGQ